MDINGYLSGAKAAAAKPAPTTPPASSASGSRAPDGIAATLALPDTMTTFGRLGAVAGCDGCDVPLPGIGPHDFGAAQRVHDAAREPAAVQMRLGPHVDAPRFVVRAYPDARQASLAWFASRLFGALGLVTPTAILVRGCATAYDGTHDATRVFLATPYLPGYSGLGRWLESDAASRVVDAADPRTQGAARVCDRLAAGRPGEEANRWRAQRCAMLPDIYQCELERQYLAALWLDNRTLCDAAMENVGIWRDQDDLPHVMTVEFGACLCADASTDIDAPPERMDGAAPPWGDGTRVSCNAVAAPFVRRLAGFVPHAHEKTIRDELRQPDGVRAVAAEMAFRLGRIDAATIRPWAADVCQLAREAQALAAHGGDMRDTDALVEYVMARRGDVLRHLGGEPVARAWARLYPTRAAAISAQQALFLALAPAARTTGLA
ncbi:hypothetical protein PMO31116_02107 [Pandoraea morbifera]|uniref:Uncharacterized protein n=1 Tax=Pandoraea morbifera TaxID=2508300 RepID=A0A5E4UM47_9BURK|nr:hypothetical protein [Pandoraea morbifera]VVE01002.1 hypothetical protein PMO31116_02107 [Pandoraea morbifera]